MNINNWTDFPWFISMLWALSWMLTRGIELLVAWWWSHEKFPLSACNRWEYLDWVLLLVRRICVVIYSKVSMWRSTLCPFPHRGEIDFPQFMKNLPSTNSGHSPPPQNFWDCFRENAAEKMSYGGRPVAVVTRYQCWNLISWSDQCCWDPDVLTVHPHHAGHSGQDISFMHLLYFIYLSCHFYCCFFYFF